jgi:hypothetical protein
MRLDAQRKDTRTIEALQSPKWDVKVVAEHNMSWLKSRGHLAQSLGLKDAVGMILHRMVLDGQFCSSMCKMLDTWKAWAENGGMRKSDLGMLEENQAVFGQATLLVAMIRDNSSALDGTLSMDLQECLRMWSKVRLG